jgi:hypothetical protein
MKRIDLQYFGTISSFQQLIKEEQIAICKDTLYKKMCFTNRCFIVSSQGILGLTIPIKGGRNQHIPIQEVEIAYDTPWQAQHVKSIDTNYKRAPFYEYYSDSLKELISRKETLLLPFIMRVHEWTKKQLKGSWEITTPIQNCQELILLEDYKPNNYMRHELPIQYTQVYQEMIGFQPNVCILDLLFCVGGKTAKSLLS